MKGACEIDETLSDEDAREIGNSDVLKNDDANDDLNSNSSI